MGKGAAKDENLIRSKWRSVGYVTATIPIDPHIPQQYQQY